MSHTQLELVYETGVSEKIDAHQWFTNHERYLKVELWPVDNGFTYIMWPRIVKINAYMVED